MTSQYELFELKSAAKFAEDLAIDRTEMLRGIIDGEDDFEVENYRFISEDAIDEIMADELENDAYILGCFNAHFLASVTNLSVDIIQALQEAEKFEALGKHIIDNDYVRGPHGLQATYAAEDGYGHHFAGYDHETLEVSGVKYFAFRTN